MRATEKRSRVLLVRKIDVADVFRLPSAMQDDKSQDAQDNPEVADISEEQEIPASTETAAELDPWEQLEQEATKWKDQAFRATAELDNFRKRMIREKADAIRYGNQRLLEDLLPVIDNFNMGMMAAEQDKSSMIYLGMNMVQKQMIDFLENQGVKEVDAAGKEFDPNVHEAISQEVTTEHAEGTILRVQRKGYMMHDRLVRPAAVVVAKAPEATESTEASI